MTVFKKEKSKIVNELNEKVDQNKLLKNKVENLQKELDQFDENFFEEIEDLKYNYSESVKKNVLYEDQLRNYSQQFGFSVTLPSIDSD